jgi:hypothetical protein
MKMKNPIRLIPAKNKIQMMKWILLRERMMALAKKMISKLILIIFRAIRI